MKQMVWIGEHLNKVAKLRQSKVGSSYLKVVNNRLLSQKTSKFTAGAPVLLDSVRTTRRKCSALICVWHAQEVNGLILEYYQFVRSHLQR